ncbi:MAG TPA: sulfotransferase [Micropepsaceae bacterium]|nr:sulfotransferase [Micropepsaceae bacterium]
MAIRSRSFARVECGEKSLEFAYAIARLYFKRRYRLAHRNVVQLACGNQGAEFRAPAPFIVGMGRSGTTLLRLMLDAHSQLAIPPETDFIGLFLRRNFGEHILCHDAFKTMTGHYDWKSFGLSRESFRAALIEKNIASRTEAMRCFYELYAQRFAKTRWGDKTPAHVPHIALLSTLLEEARFIHIIRDGRDVVTSMRGMWFAPARTVSGIARAWVETINDTRRQGLTIKHYLELRYEDLIMRPEIELRKICAFIDLPYEPSMIDYHKRAAERLAELEAVNLRFGLLRVTGNQRRYNHRRTSDPPSASRIGRWRSELNARDIGAVDRVAGPLLRELGYGA